ncbi:MAG: GspE/PulE family protein [Desulfuromonadaceae bacterium]|nr:GspE/PulE family protein [Desulfuromonadaceae bacterium]
MEPADFLKKQLEFRKQLMDRINDIHSAQSLVELMQQISTRIPQLFLAERITIYLADLERNQLVSKVLSGSELISIILPISHETLAGHCALNRQVVHVKNAYDEHELRMVHSDLRFNPDWDRRSGFVTRQVLCVPMQLQGQFIGVIQILNKRGPEAFTAQDVEFAGELATALAIALVNNQRQKQPAGEGPAAPVRRAERYDYLMDKGLVNEEQLQQAQKIAREEKISADVALMRLAKIDRATMGKALSLYFSTDFIHFDRSRSAPLTLLERLKPELLRNDIWVPIGIENGIILVAMEDPRDLQKQGLIAYAFPGQRKIRHLAAFRDDILSFIDLFYNQDSQSDLKFGSMQDILNSATEQDEPEIEQEIKQVSEEDSALVKMVNKIICDAHQANASDIHIEPYPGKNDVVVRIRVDGRCKIYQRIPYKYKYALSSRIKIMAGLDIAERRKPQDGKITFKKYGPLDIELRVATVPTANHVEDVVLRLLASGEPLPFEKLGLTPRNLQVVTEAIHKPYGLILCVGPTGSGKTTTLHSAIALINTPETKIWTAEDPVEITQKGLRQVQMNPKIGLNFAAALRSFLRADPDVIMVGEMRDEETAAIGIESSLTGHLVFSTLHTNSAPETVTRLLDMGMDPFSFSDALLVIIAQRLARRACPDCLERYAPDEQQWTSLADEYGAEAFAQLGLQRSSAQLVRTRGCERCGQSGYRGRLGLHEVLECSDEMKELIKKKEEVAHVRALAMRQGMTTLKQDGILKVLQGLTDLQEVRRVCIK